MIREDGLLKCPFCNGDAAFGREGTSRQSCIINCSDCGCRLESNETWNSGKQWNERAAGVWRPIETAPRDGTIIILWSAAFKESYHGLWDIWTKKPCWKRTSNKKADATYWQSLPKPPTGE